MNTKGIALETAVKLIAGIVFLIVVMYMLLQTGLLTSFVERINTTVCTASSIGRGIILAMIWSFFQALLIILTFIQLISGIGGYGAGAVQASRAGFFIKQALKNFALKGITATSVLTLGVGTIAAYILIAKVFSAVPLICPTTVINVGAADNPTTIEDFYTVASSRTVDCWSMYGEGKFNPLWGKDPPNPRTCFILETHLEEPTSIQDLYLDMRATYGDNWKLGEEKIWVYCGSQDKGKDFSDWSSSACNIQNHKMYIMYYDKHPYDDISYFDGGFGDPSGSAACDMRDSILNMNQVFEEDKDMIVWCIEPI